MARRRKHLVYEVRVGSVDDELPKDRVYYNGRRSICPQKLPVRATYIIEASAAVADKRAIQLAIEDGIERPILMGSQLLNFHNHNEW